jgi:hypothetical protein
MPIEDKSPTKQGKWTLDNHRSLWDREHSNAEGKLNGEREEEES